ncbi:hypothetical protein PROFUN_01656 [Planoprotostelium fungivorum]|uniref:BHLH domain-containing protein n=1 Tax=Planoprotostelium fungivorum TaxID=1890364 RepID=A0A2P6MW47_9EUKA|nr:hypothetical protein PROFUN_01656 [Planoprotostelium fungivorum]
MNDIQTAETPDMVEIERMKAGLKETTDSYDRMNSPNVSDDHGEKSKKRKVSNTSRVSVPPPNLNMPGAEARRESHKIIEQRRRQKINEKINELREILNYPEGVQNKAVVLQAAVEHIKNLKTIVGKLSEHQRQAQEDYIHLLHENERLKSYLTPEALAQVAAQSEPHTGPITADGPAKESWLDPNITATYNVYSNYNRPMAGDHSPAFHHVGVGHNLNTLAALSTLDYGSETGVDSQATDQDDQASQGQSSESQH